MGGGFVLLFITAGVWQLERADEKRADRNAFADSPVFRRFSSGNELTAYEGIEVRGRWLGEQQILLDNIIVATRVGHYVLTALEVSADEPLVIVNRGFLPMQADGIRAEDIAVGASERTVRGRVGRLPRAGYRMGAAIPEVSGWPVHAVYPVYKDIELTLGRAVEPFVLLLDAAETDGFERNWQPEGIGPGRHTAYAVQWFAMAVVLTGLLAWHARRRSFDHE